MRKGDTVRIKQDAKTIYIGETGVVVDDKIYRTRPETKLYRLSVRLKNDVVLRFREDELEYANA